MRGLALAVVLVASIASAGSVGLKAVGPKGVDEKTVRSALGAWVSLWIACVPEEAPATFSESVRYVVSSDHSLEPPDGLVMTDFDNRCMSAMLSVAPKVPASIKAGELVFEVIVASPVKERSEWKAKHLAELKRFCTAAQKLKAKGEEEAFQQAAFAQLKNPAQLTGKGLFTFNTMLQLNPADYRKLLEMSAKEAGGSFECKL